MRWPERCSRTIAFVGAWMFLCLALVSGASRASTASMAEARPMVVLAMPAAAMPQMLDCPPCARCYVAPAPVAHGVSAEPAGTRRTKQARKRSALPSGSCCRSITARVRRPRRTSTKNAGQASRPSRRPARKQPRKGPSDEPT